MNKPHRAPWLAVMVALLALVFAPAVALAGPRSGGSFGGRSGFRSGGGSSFSMPRSYSDGRGYSGGGSNYVFVPSPGWGWGWGRGYGYGYGGGFGLFGTLVIMAVAGIAIAGVVRAVRRAQRASDYDGSYESVDDAGPVEMPGRAYLYKLQLALGRSARGVQDRLAEFASQGDTNTEEGLGALLQQTALELLRQKDSVRYAAAEAHGPMSFTNAETAMNGAAMTERSRFEVERVRASDGRVNRSSAAAEEGKEALELVVVTVIAATRTPLGEFKPLATPGELGSLLSELGAVSGRGLLGLEVIWTPADPIDSMTETDVMTTYPELRSI
jgi:uncharacterized membrane protein